MSNFLDALTLAYPKKEIQTAPAGQEAFYLDKNDWNDLCQRVTAITNMLSGALQVYKSGDATTMYSILAVTGSPNGSVSATKGSLAVDPAAPALYQNTNGGTAWSAVGGGGTAWVTNFLSDLTLSTGTSTVYNDVNLGTLGAVSYVRVNCTDGGSSIVTGFAGGTTAGQIIIYHNIHGSQAHRVGTHELSTAGNQIEAFGFSDFTVRADTVATFMYDGTYWLQIGITTAG